MGTYFKNNGKIVVLKSFSFYFQSQYIIYLFIKRRIDNSANYMS